MSRADTTRAPNAKGTTMSTTDLTGPDLTGPDLTKPATSGRLTWRVVDIVVASILGVACGLLYWVYDFPGYGWYSSLNAFLPGLGGITNGVWLIACVLGALVIRKPGAAILVEVIAASVEAIGGNQWGLSNIWIGLVQGLGAELVFLAFLYRRFSLPVSMLAGAGAGVASWAYSFATGDYAKSFSYNALYLATSIVSGALIAGVLAWVLTQALARTGVLNRFASGRRRAPGRA